jgi:hypothetical protein
MSRICRNRSIIVELYTLVTLIFGVCLPVVAHAERAVIYLPETTNFLRQAQAKAVGNIVQDLSPLPWVVIDTFRPITMLRTTSPVYRDVRGRFAATPIPPDDTEYSKQWHLTAIGAPEMWQLTQGAGVTVALIDSGVDYQHPDLKENILYDQGYNFGDKTTNVQDWTGHGTAMAGLIAGVCHNQIGICGVAPQAKIIPFKINVQDQTDFASTDLALAILTAAGSEADILSMSLTLDEYAPWVEHALEYARLKGKSLVIAAGNQGQQVSFPANLPYVISVAAHDKSGSRLSRSNFGQALKISAPGIDLWSTGLGNTYLNVYADTSGATALVAGALALLKAQYPTMSAPELQMKVLAWSEDVGEMGLDTESGAGLLNLSECCIFATKILYYTQQMQDVYHYGDTLTLNLVFEHVAGRSGDLFLRFNIPSQIQSERVAVFKVWHNADNSVKIPFNQLLASPYLFADDLNLALFGGDFAIFGTGTITSDLPEGIYELFAQLELHDGERAQARKFLWVIHE